MLLLFWRGSRGETRTLRLVEKRREADEEGLLEMVARTLVPDVTTCRWPCPVLSSPGSLPALLGSCGPVMLG